MALASLGARNAQALTGNSTVVYELPAGRDPVQAAKSLTGVPGIAYAEPDRLLKVDAVTPNDPYFKNQWALAKMKTPDAWTLALGSSAVKVAVLDTGWDTDHQDLVGKVVLSKDFTVADGSANTVEDGHGHGTHCCGIVAATTNNAKGVSSAGWKTSLMVGKVMGNNGSGYLSEIATGITWAADNGAKVISLSLGGPSGSTTLENACKYATNKNCLVVAAAGNNANTAANYPAYYATCVAVASTTDGDARSSFSNYGSWVDVAAPGSNILSTYNNGGYATMSGTSMATPEAAAVAALIWSRGATSVTAVRNTLIGTGDPVTSGFASYPLRRVNAGRAVGALK
jgi:thermitase